MSVYELECDGEATMQETSLLPEGNYVLACVSYKEKTAKSGRPLISTAFEAVRNIQNPDEEVSGSWVWHNVTLIPAGQKGHGMLIHFLKQMGQPFDGNLRINPENWLGARIEAHVIVTEYDGKQRNEIAEIFSVIGEGEESEPVDSLKDVQAEARAAASEDDIPF